MKPLKKLTKEEAKVFVKKNHEELSKGSPMVVPANATAVINKVPVTWALFAGRKVLARGKDQNLYNHE